MTSSATQPTQPTRSVWTLDNLLLLGGVTLFILALWMAATQFIGTESTVQDLSKAQIAFEDATGIRIVRVVMTAAGGMADIQYQILDPDKALIVHDEEAPPTIINQRNGAALNFPYHEHGFSELSPARIYRLHLVNRGNLLARGDKVTVRVGDAELRDLLVE